MIFYLKKLILTNISYSHAMFSLYTLFCLLTHLKKIDVEAQNINAYTARKLVYFYFYKPEFAAFFQY